MRHLRNYIIKIEGQEFNDTFKTEGGLELYGDKDFTYKKQVNPYATIIEKPVNGGELENGTKVFIDPTIFYHFLYEDGRKHNTQFTIDKKEGLYHIDPSMIILYEKDGQWIGFGKNLLGINEVIKEDDVVKNGIIIEFQGKKKKETVKLVYPNKDLMDEGLKSNDEMYISKIGGVPVYIDGKEYLWLRTKDVMAIKK